jgi:hypothetical protein
VPAQRNASLGALRIASTRRPGLAARGRRARFPDAILRGLVSDLFAAACSIAPTRRRRFLWAAWWTAPPAREPFRKPDAYEGGARTREEALRAAERAAGVRLVEVESSWARAWARVLLGQPPWDKHRPAGARRPAAARPGEGSPASIWAILGVPPHTTGPALKQAFRQRALATHPDRGGDPAAFREVQRAYDEAVRRGDRPRRRR